MVDAALLAFENLLDPARLGFLFLGVLIGLGVGIIPGIGGPTAMAILLPFTLKMDEFMSVALLIGIASTTVTSDPIPAILLGIPGTAAGQATIIDGHAMAKKGEAGRALGAGYMSSLLGGLFGALVLIVSFPILRAIVLAFGSPEFFMLSLWGLSMIGVLSGGAPLKGLAAAALGTIIGMVGTEPRTGITRWTFDNLYLTQGLSLMPVTLGLFAMPETVDLAVSGTTVARLASDKISGTMEGVRDAFRHWFLVLRCSALGAWIGAIPGLGGSVVDWVSYGHALQTEKGARQTFGKGDVRGVIAPESANNALLGGALIPTLAFGIPGNVGTALLLIALSMQGLILGEKVFTERMDLAYTMVWSLAIANVFGAAICLLFSNQLARITMVKAGRMVPFIVTVAFLAAFQTTAAWGDLVSLMAFSVLGSLMKQLGWPRPPLIIGLILSPLMENYLFISNTRYGWGWAARPGVLLIALLTVGSVIYGFAGGQRPKSGDLGRKVLNGG